MKTLLILLMLWPATLFAAPACCSTNLPAGGAATDKSLYQLESVWTSDYEKQMNLGKLQGEVQVVTMFFASCEYACPILVYDTKKIEAALQGVGVTNVGFVLVTFDTERDTVEQLHAYRKRQALDDKWILLRGDSQDVLELAALLGVKYKKDARGQFAHSNVISVLNQRGELIHQQVGLNVDPAATVAAIRAAVRPNSSN